MGNEKRAKSAVKDVLLMLMKTEELEVTLHNEREELTDFMASCTLVKC